jgi:hypothetical protein
MTIVRDIPYTFSWLPLLTVVSTGNTATGLAVGSRASVLLQASVGDAAFTAGDRSTTVLAILAGNKNRTARCVADTFSVDGAGGGKGSEAENEGGDRELHFGLLKRRNFLFVFWTIDCDEDVGCEMD